MRTKTTLLTVFLILANALQAAIVFDSNVVSDTAIVGSTLTISNYTPTSSTNALLIVGFVGDGSNSSSETPTFNGNEMTQLSFDQRTMLFGYELTDTTQGDIVINVTAPNNMVVYGTLTGVDTSNLGTLSTSEGATASDETLTMDSALTVNAGDYVFTALNNNFNASSYYTGSAPSTGLSELAFVSESSYTAGIYGGIINSPGSYTPSATWTGGTGTGAEAYGSAVVFTAIPEPSSIVLLGLAAMTMFAFRRRRN